MAEPTTRKRKKKTLTVQEMAHIALKDLLPKQPDPKDPRSKKLKYLLNRVPKIPLQKLEKWRDQVFEQARSEGFDDMLIGKWVRKAMDEAEYSDRWIRKMLPDTAKGTQGGASVTRDKTEQSSVNTGTISIMDEAQGIAVRSPSTEPVPGSYTSSHQQMQESKDEVEDEAPTGYYQIPMEQFRIEDVEQYDRLFLIKVVHYLYNKIAELEKKEKKKK